MTVPGPDTPSAIAAEHALWAASVGLTPYEVIGSTGIRWHSLREPRWDDAVLALAVAWRRCGAAPIRRAA